MNGEDKLLPFSFKDLPFTSCCDTNMRFAITYYLSIRYKLYMYKCCHGNVYPALILIGKLVSIAT